MDAPFAKVWEEEVIIPTYPVGAAEKNPMFLEKRVYQGSSGVVYPHPVIEKIMDEKKDQQYRAVFLENEYLKIMILPQLGGRVQMAFDKTRQRHFIYYNRVIKPALVGLTGPWISGGIEFNWPQHHRPSTYEPLDYTIRENEDGSKTVWVNEIERMFRTKGMTGFTLRPGKAYLEISGKLYNRTPFPQSFLWWANPAVKVNDHYQSVFPPDVYAVFDHGKRDVSSFPIATGVYYKVDYSPGTDISRYKNIPVPTSYMAISSKYNFIGGYEHDSRGGLLHVADHHISPGKKQWTWGHGSFGQAWDRNLTDEDGPYIELMTGVYTDNQPDFSWLQPYEQKSFTQYFMPYGEVGLVKNATKEALVNLEFDTNEASILVYTTAWYERLEISLAFDGKELFSEITSCRPGLPYIKSVEWPANAEQEQALVKVKDLATGKILVSYRPEAAGVAEIPRPAAAAKSPADVENNEQLYLTGLHLEQYRHATYRATDYYEEALRRDPGDVRNNNALGLWYLRRGQFAKAEPFFRTAIATLTQRNPNPYDGEPFFNLGWALKLQGRREAAFDAFYKSVWNDAWQHAGYLELARIAVSRNELEEAHELIGKSLVKNTENHSARHAKVFILRKLQHRREAAAFIEESLQLDPFNLGCLFEKYLLLQPLDPGEAEKVVAQLRTLSRGWVHNYIEFALDYSQAGLYEEAEQLLGIYAESADALYPMVEYYLGWFANEAGQDGKALEHFKKAAALSPDFVFPNRVEDVPVLQMAATLNPGDAKALYYLGNFWYDRRQYDDAIESWEGSLKRDDRFPTVHRNLSLAYFNKRQDPGRALAFMNRAFELDETDARVLMELDQLRKRLNHPNAERLSRLEKFISLTESRDDLYLERVALYNLAGCYDKARDLIAARQFHPWEGGEGKVVRQYLLCHTELAKEALEKGRLEEALELIREAGTYPPNLGEGKLPGARENDLHYLKGLVYEKMGMEEPARSFFMEATSGNSEPVQAIFYNDPQPDQIFYQGLAWRKLGEPGKASAIFQSLINFGDQHMNDHITIDYFAVSLPDLLVFDADLDLRNRIHCLYLKALGHLGLGGDHLASAGQLFDEVLRLENHHQGAVIHRRMTISE